MGDWREGNAFILYDTTNQRYRNEGRICAIGNTVESVKPARG